MLALAITPERDHPLCVRPLDGKPSDNEHRSAAVHEVTTQMREQLPEEHDQRRAACDRGEDSKATRKIYHDAAIC